MHILYFTMKVHVQCTCTFTRFQMVIQVDKSLEVYHRIPTVKLLKKIHVKVRINIIHEHVLPVFPVVTHAYKLKMKKSKNY